MRAAGSEGQMVLKKARSGIGENPKQLQPRGDLLQPEGKIEFRADHRMARIGRVAAKRDNAEVHHDAEGQRGRFLQRLKFPAGGGSLF